MSAKVEVRGRLYYVGPVETFASGFRKRTAVIQDTSSKFEDCLAVELAKDRADAVKPEDKGRECAVVGYVHSRSWTDPKTGKTKWFTSVDAVRLTFGAAAPTAKEAEAAAVSDIAAKIGEAEESLFGDADDMPF